jgi:predicted aspartyl protease
MGEFSVPVRVSHPTELTRGVTLELLVDTGSTLSVVAADVLRSLGIEPRRMDAEFETATGSVSRMAVGAASFTVDGREMVGPVVFGEPRDTAVLGAVALESLGLIVDPLGRRLVPRRFLRI